MIRASLRFLIVLATFWGLLFHATCQKLQDTKDVVFIILSQPNSYHERVADEKKVDIVNQVLLLGYGIPRVYIAPKDFPDLYGYWTIFPLLQRLSDLSNCSWVFFCEEVTQINMKALLALMSSYNATENHFLGFTLRDEEATIIHHFDVSDGHFNIAYPDFAAGFIMSFPLLRRASSKWVYNGEVLFSIDAKYELAKYLFEGGMGTMLVNVPQLCLIKTGNQCATWVEDLFPECGPPVARRKIYFGVKTCEKFHKTRVKVVKNTWANETTIITYFSDVADPTIPSVSLGIENVASGHCEKTLSLIKYVVDSRMPVEWLVLADDDTLLSVPRLRKLLACYNPKEPMAIGERYGFGLNTDHGYDYITGGGGIVLSVPVLRRVLGGCICPAIDSPDDMILGMCLQRIGIPLTHSTYFHQARPMDYNPKFLKHQKPISFHKHWMLDPYEVYRNELQDRNIFNADFHIEL